MKWFTSFAAACLALMLAAAPPAAAATIPANTFSPAELGMNAVALSTNPSFTVRVGGYHQAAVTVVLTRSAATTLALRCTAGPNSAVQALLGAAVVDGTTGQITLVQVPNFKYAVSASGTYRWLVGPLLDDTLICGLSGASSTTSDLVSGYLRVEP